MVSMLDSILNRLKQIDIIRWNLIALITTKFTPPASSKQKNTNKFITTKYTPPLNRLASSNTRNVLLIVCSSVRVYLLFLSTGHSPLTIDDSLLAGHATAITIF
jgi:hypothetical protein